MAVRGDAASKPMPTLTEQWVADEADKARIAGLCQALGFNPAQVSAMTFTVGPRGINVSITRVAHSAKRG